MSSSSPSQQRNDPLAPESLVFLKSYKYSSVDKSPLSHYVLRHWWNAFVELMPPWLAPNTITLLGFSFILVNIVLLSIYIPDLVGPGPSWIYFSFAFGMFMYQTFDNVDGKQARRTGTSSPLGELFDHGVDSLNCTLASLCETAALAQGSTKLGAFTALVPCLPMFLSTWETYHTHTLYLGYFNGPTEGLLLAAVFMVISGLYGPDFWQHKVADFVGLEAILGNVTLRQCWVPMVLIAFFTAHLPECVMNVANARRRKNLPLAPVFVEWMPLVAYIGSAMAWLGSPYSCVLDDNHLVLFCLTMSFVFGRMTTKMILHHLTHCEFPMWTIVLLPLVGGAVIVNMPYFGLPPLNPAVELMYLKAFFVFAGVAYFGWAVKVCNTFCTYLDINCLTIKHRQTRKGSKPN